AEQKAKEEAEAQLKKEQEKIRLNNSKTYSVQILSLSNFSEKRLNSYCTKHKISNRDIIKRNVNGLTKISYGKVKTPEEATLLQKKLKNENGITESFIVVFP
ncbi:MAG: SPOR domain-containing protein, partial [Vicingaceae bacterium]|nr:SPOR domain-containing protein [Vicingaceae bacterium]